MRARSLRASPLFLNSPLPQIAVTLFDGKRERLTLNQSFTGVCVSVCVCLCVNQSLMGSRQNFAPLRVYL